MLWHYNTILEKATALPVLYSFASMYWHVYKEKQAMHCMHMLEKCLQRNHAVG